MKTTDLASDIVTRSNTNTVNQTSSYLKSQPLSLHNRLSSLFHSAAFHSNCLTDKSPDGHPHPCGEMGEVEEVGVVWRLRGGRWDCPAPEASEERAKNAEAIRKEKQTQTDRDQRRAIYALTDSPTPLDNDRLRSSIKGWKNNTFVQRSVKSFYKCLWMGSCKIIRAKLLFFHNSPKKNVYLGAMTPFFMYFKFLCVIYCTQK